MTLRAWRFGAVLLAALSLTMEAAHVLEMPQKMQYDLNLYTAVNGTLYRYFAIVGGAWQVGAILATAVLAAFLRGSGTVFRWSMAAAACLLAAFLTWAAVVEPVNRVVAEVSRRTPQDLPATWAALRRRWEFGHAAGFVVQLAGFSALAVSILLDTPARRLSPRAARRE